MVLDTGRLPQHHHNQATWKPYNRSSEFVPSLFPHRYVLAKPDEDSNSSAPACSSSRPEHRNWRRGHSRAVEGNPRQPQTPRRNELVRHPDTFASTPRTNLPSLTMTRISPCCSASCCAVLAITALTSAVVGLAVPLAQFRLLASPNPSRSHFGPLKFRPDGTFHISIFEDLHFGESVF